MTNIESEMLEAVISIRMLQRALGDLESIEITANGNSVKFGPFDQNAGVGANLLIDRICVLAMTPKTEPKQ